jgi:hypothetical protein
MLLPRRVLQVVWTSGATNCLHTDMDADAVDRLRALIRAQQSTCAESAAAAAAAVPAAPVAAADAAQPGLQQQGRQKDGVSAFASGDASSRSKDIATAPEAAADKTTTPCSRSTSWLSPSVHVASADLAKAAAAGSTGSSSSASSEKGSSKGSSSSSGWTIIPDTPSSSFLKWAGPLVDEGVRLFADLPAWMSQ